MASDLNIISPDEHVAQQVGELFSDYLSFLGEQRRKLAALSQIESSEHENKADVPTTPSSNNRLVRK